MLNALLHHYHTFKKYLAQHWYSPHTEILGNGEGFHSPSGAVCTVVNTVNGQNAINRHTAIVIDTGIKLSVDVNHCTVEWVITVVHGHGIM